MGTAGRYDVPSQPEGTACYGVRLTRAESEIFPPAGTASVAPVGSRGYIPPPHHLFSKQAAGIVANGVLSFCAPQYRRKRFDLTAECTWQKEADERTVWPVAIGAVLCLSAPDSFFAAQLVSAPSPPFVRGCVFRPGPASNKHATPLALPQVPRLGAPSKR